MKITMIACIDSNWDIGDKSGIPWKMPTDMELFKQWTEGTVVIMGHNTWDSIPSKYKPLSNRINIVIGSIGKFNDYRENVIVCSCVEEALFHANTYGLDVMIIGGGMTYKSFLPYASNIVLTKLKGVVRMEDPVGFPRIDKMDTWKLMSVSELAINRGDQFRAEVCWYARRLSGSCLLGGEIYTVGEAVRVLNRALTLGEITELYNAGVSKQPWEYSQAIRGSYVLALPLNNGVASGREFEDYSGNENDLKEETKNE